MTEARAERVPPPLELGSLALIVCIVYAGPFDELDETGTYCVCKELVEGDVTEPGPATTGLPFPPIKIMVGSLETQKLKY